MNIARIVMRRQRDDKMTLQKNNDYVYEMNVSKMINNIAMNSLHSVIAMQGQCEHVK